MFCRLGKGCLLTPSITSMQQEPRSRAEMLRLFVESVLDYAFILVDTENRITEWNVGAERLLGYSEEEILGQSADTFFTPEDRARQVPRQEMATAARDGRAEDERYHMRKDGSQFRASGVMVSMRDDQGALVGFAKVMRDVTERELARQHLEKSLRERSLLLGEVHHRVKNNLQVIVSLMSLQAKHITEPEVLSMFEETQNRVMAIARIHERLYSTDDFATVHFGNYLKQLVRELVQFYGMADRVSVHVNTADLALDIDQAIPLALIGNELVCNAMKHAFPDGRQGSVTVNLQYGTSPEGRVSQELSVSDDGVGLPADFDFATAGSMGIHLVRILSGQLQADVRICRTRGTSVVVAFPVQEMVH